ncbi:MAG: di-trans,poly-cis-decaprenylcistransferase, partial [Clostridiales bacterium]|nr:di-trans,poly-cis-decaprenylcistransferase [Clostridiales bacterium]
MRLLKFLGKIVDAKIGMNLLLDKVTSRSIPEHVCIIMDGNGRWAQRKGLPRTAGHRQGMEMMRDIISISSEIGIKYLTLYAFSTENWKRPKSEIQAIMALLVEYLQIELDALHKNDVRIVTVGDTTLLPQEAYQEIENAVLKTSQNNGLQVNVALNYGGR